MLTVPGERRPVTPSNREARSAALHQMLQAADTIYPESVVRLGVGKGNLLYGVLRSLDSIQLEGRRYSATAYQIGERMEELDPSAHPSKKLSPGDVQRAIDALVIRGDLKSRRILGSGRGKLAATESTFYNRPKDQQPITAHSR